MSVFKDFPGLENLEKKFKYYQGPARPLLVEQAVVIKHNKPRPRVAHRGIARFLWIDPKLNQVIQWSLHTFPENFMQIGPAIFS